MSQGWGPCCYVFTHVSALALACHEICPSFFDRANIFPSEEHLHWSIFGSPNRPCSSQGLRIKVFVRPSLDLLHSSPLHPILPADFPWALPLLLGTLAFPCHHLASRRPRSQLLVMGTACLKAQREKPLAEL